LIHRGGASHANADALSRRPCNLDCRQCVRHQAVVSAVVTRRQAAQQAGASAAGDVGSAIVDGLQGQSAVQDANDRAGGLDKSLRSRPPTQPTLAGAAVRKRQRKRGSRRVPPLASTDVTELIPEGQWTQNIYQQHSRQMPS